MLNLFLKAFWNSSHTAQILWLICSRKYFGDFVFITPYDRKFACLHAISYPENRWACTFVFFPLLNIGKLAPEYPLFLNEQKWFLINVAPYQKSVQPLLHYWNPLYTWTENHSSLFDISYNNVIVKGRPQGIICLPGQLLSLLSWAIIAIITQCL